MIDPLGVIDRMKMPRFYRNFDKISLKSHCQKMQPRDGNRRQQSHSRICRIFPAAVNFAILLPLFVLQTGMLNAEEPLNVYRDAANFQNNQSYDLAIEEWERFLKEFPDHQRVAEARYYLGVCYLQTNELEKAANCFQPLVDQKNPGEKRFTLLEDAYLNLGSVHFKIAKAEEPNEKKKKQHYAKAEETYSALVNNFPQGKYADQALFFIGECHYALDNRDEAMKAYRQLVENHPNSVMRADGIYALGVAQEESKDFTGAETTYTSFLAAYADHDYAAEVGMRKAETVLHQGDVDRARTLFAKASSQPDFPQADRAVYRQAHCAVLQKDYAAAGDLYASIVNRFAESSYALTSMLDAGRCYYRAEQSKKARQWLDRVMASGSDNVPESAHWICQLLIRNREFTNAVQLAERILPQSKSSNFLVELKMDLADAIYELTDQQREAMDQFIQIAKDHPDHKLAPQALYNACYAALELKQYEETSSLSIQFTNRFKQHALTPDVLRVAAESHLMADDPARAEDRYQQLIEKYEDHPEVPAWRVRYATAMFLQKKYRPTISAFSDPLTEIEDVALRAEAFYLVGASQFHLQLFEQASQSLDNSLQVDTNWSGAGETVIVLARSLHHMSRPVEAIDLLNQLLSQSPDTPLGDRIHFRLAQCHFDNNKMNEAASHYGKVVTSWPQSSLAPHAYYGKGLAEMRQQAHKKAEATHTNLIEKHPQHDLFSQALYARAICRQRVDKHEDVITDIDRLLELDSQGEERAEAIYLRGTSLVALEKYPAASVSFKTILENWPDFGQTPNVLYELAWSEKSAGEHETALEIFQQLTNRFSDHELAGESWYHVGRAQYEKNLFRPATLSFAKAGELSEDQQIVEKSTYMSGWAHYRADNFDPALVQFTQLIKQFPAGEHAADGRFMSGECLFKLERYKEALAAYDTARQTPLPENLTVLALLHGGQCASALEDWSTSLEWLTVITEKFPKADYVQESLFEQGVAYHHLDHLDDAFAAFEKVVQQSRNELGARARFHMGEVDFTKKDFLAALKNYRRVLYGFGGDQAGDDIKPWQARSAFQAAQTSLILAGQTNNSAKKQMFIKNARGFYAVVVEKDPESELANVAAEKIKDLKSSP